MNKTKGILNSSYQERMIKFSIVFILLFMTVSCGNSMQKVTMRIGKGNYRIEIARTPQERQKGLMQRKSIPEYSGMLFVFKKDQRLSFWMKNTLIPLSIAYISSNGIVKEIYSMVPESLSPVNSIHFIRYALELREGAFKHSGVKPGDKIILPDDVR